MSHPDNTFQSDLARAKGLGAGHNGVKHWWTQRITAIAMVPLGIWLLISLVHIRGYSYDQVRIWLGHPLHAALMLATIATGFYHGMLGLQVIIEDYVHKRIYKTTLLIGLRLLMAAMILTAGVAMIECLDLKGN